MCPRYSQIIDVIITVATRSFSRFYWGLLLGGFDKVPSKSPRHYGHFSFIFVKKSPQFSMISREKRIGEFCIIFPVLFRTPRTIHNNFFCMSVIRRQPIFFSDIFLRFFISICFRKCHFWPIPIEGSADHPSSLSKKLNFFLKLPKFDMLLSNWMLINIW